MNQNVNRNANQSASQKSTALNTELFSEIAELIIDAVNLHHFPKEKITPETSLRENGLGLDSIDILEIVVTIEKKYGVSIKTADEGATHFRTIGTIVEFVQTHANRS